MKTGGWALITGASSGIGYEYARVLAEKGYPLLMVSNEEIRLQEKAVLLKQHYRIDIIPLYMDLAEAEAPCRLHDFCMQEGLQIDILINNAGIFYFGEVLQQSAAHIAKMLTLHVQTTTLLCRMFGEDMKRRGQGYILNMSSLSAWTAYPGIALYAATKSYLKNFSRAFRAEMREYGVGVTTLCPGAIATDLYHLDKKLQRLAVRLGVMMKPERLARRGIKAMFRRRARVVPGWTNHLFLPLARVLPARWIRTWMRMSGLLPLQ